MADNVVGADIDPLTPTITPGAQTALNGGAAAGDNLAREKAEYFRTQRERMERLGEREEELYAQREKEEEPLRRGYETALKNFASTSDIETERLVGSQQNIPKFDPKQAQADAFGWFAAASAFGALAGARARGSATTALNAFAGMTSGFVKGNLTLFDQKYKEWEAASERARDINARAVNEYKAIMSNKQLNLDVQANLMQMTASKYQDQIMANAAQLRDIERMTQLMNAQDRADERLQLSHDAFAEHKKIWDFTLQQRKDQVYGRDGDVEAAAQRIQDLDSPFPSPQMQARYPYLRDALAMAKKRSPGITAGDYAAKQAVQKLAATGDVMAMRQSLTKMTDMREKLATFEPIAKQNGQVILALVNKVDQTGTQSVFEAWLRAGRKATDDPDVQQFDMAVNNLKFEAGRIINNPAMSGVLTEGARAEIGSLLPENITVQNAQRAVPFLFNEMDYRKRLIDSRIEYLQGSIENISKGQRPPTYQSPEPPPLIPPPIIIQGGGGGGDLEYTPVD
jgi:hypothetical protein